MFVIKRKGNTATPEEKATSNRQIIIFSVYLVGLRLAFSYLSGSKWTNV